MEMLHARVLQRDGRIVVESGDGRPLGMVRGFDVTGRCVAMGDAVGCVSTEGVGRVVFDVPTSGTYLVRIGDYQARRIMVIR